jgi:hypothetical protein
MNYFNVFNKLYEKLNSINETDNISSKIIENSQKMKIFIELFIQKELILKVIMFLLVFKEEYIK